jgi:hypothetical protein
MGKTCHPLPKPLSNLDLVNTYVYHVNMDGQCEFSAYLHGTLTNETVCEFNLLDA